MKLITGEPGLRDVDLVIRTGGEQRLSDVLLWESAQGCRRDPLLR